MKYISHTMFTHKQDYYLHFIISSHRTFGNNPSTYLPTVIQLMHTQQNRTFWNTLGWIQANTRPACLQQGYSIEVVGGRRVFTGILTIGIGGNPITHVFAPLPRMSLYGIGQSLVYSLVRDMSAAAGRGVLGCPLRTGRNLYCIPIAIAIFPDGPYFYQDVPCLE